MPVFAELSPALEDYLEVVWNLLAEKGVARVRDIARKLGVHKSSVTAAMKSLSKKQLVNYSPYEMTTLTPKGRGLAQEIVQRHEVIRRFLVDVLSVEPHVAEANACRMEHVMDREVLERLVLFAQFVKVCPRAGKDWVEQFRYFFEHQGQPCLDDAKVDAWMSDFRKKVNQRKQMQESDKTMTTLNELKPGQSGRIVRVGNVGPIKRRIVDMGVVRGTPVEMIKVAPLGDPIEIKVKGYNLTLRKEEAAAISVEPE